MSGQRQGRVHRIHGYQVADARSARQASHQVEENGRCGVLRAHGTGVDDAPSPRHGRDEEPVLVIEHRCASGPHGIDEFFASVLPHAGSSRARVRQQVCAQDSVAQPQVWPRPVLQAGEDDDLPVAAHRLGGGEDLDARGPHAHA